MKRFFFLLLSIAVFFLMIASPASAESFFTGNSLESFQCGEPVITDEVNTALDDYIENDANMAEKFLTSQAQNFFHIGDINGISTLIFGNPYCVWNSDSDTEATMASNGVFTDDEMEKIIEPMVNLLGSLFVIVMTIAFLFSGLKIMATSVRGHAMANFWEDAGMWFFALLLALFYYEFIDLLFQLNAAFVLSVRDLITNINPDALDGFSVMSSLKDFLNIGFMGSFLLIVVAEWLLAGLLNIIYISRKVIIVLLIFMGVIAIYSLMFAKTRGFFMNWIRELVGNIFLQSIHALVFFAIIQFVNLGAGVFFKLVLMMMFIPVSGMISKWLSFDDSSSKIGTGLTMVGLGGAVSTMMLAQQARNIVGGGTFNQGGAMFGGSFGGGTGGGPGGGGPGGGGLTQLANNMANDMTATSIGMRAQGNSDSTLFNLSKEAGGKLGSFVGSGAGMVLGPAGVVAGNKFGGAIGEGVPQIGRNLAVASQGIAENFSAMRNFEGVGGEKGVKALFGNGQSNGTFDTLNARRQVMSNIGESVGLAVGGQKGAQLGRSFGAAMSGVSRQRLNEANATQLGAAMGMDNINGAMSFAHLAEKFPNADAKWVQTNQGSSFHINTDDGFQQVGITGSADGNLADGQARVMDFKLADSSLDYSLQANGTYKPDNDLFKSSLQNTGAVNDSIPSFENAMTGSVDNALTSSLDNAAISSNLSSLEGSSSNVMSFDEAMGSQNIIPEGSSSVSFMGASDVGVTGGAIHAENISSVPTNDFIQGSEIGGSVPTNDFIQGSEIGSSAPSSISTNDVVQGSESSGTPAAIGLQGSTPNVMRTSDAYIVSGIDTSKANQVAEIASKTEVSKVQDSSFRATNVNPDSYIFQGVKGSQVSTSDQVANNVQTTGKVASHWQQKLKQNRVKQKKRKRDIV